MANIDYEKLSACIADARRDCLELKIAKSASIAPYKVTMLAPFEKENGFVIEENDNTIAVCTVGGNGYIMHDFFSEGEDLYALIKGIETATGRKTYPSCGNEPWSWKGILAENFEEERENWCLTQEPKEEK